MPTSINPANGQEIATYESMSWSEIHEILEGTTDAAKGWSTISPGERAKLMDKAGDVLEEKRDQLALLITREMGKPIREARSEIEKCVWVCRYYAENGPSFLNDEPLSGDSDRQFAAFQPLGVILAVMPWNFPFWQVFRFAAPGLVAGNGAILKHASNVTGCAMAIEEIFKEAGFPEDLFRTIIAGPVEVQRAINSDFIQAATLTGSEPAGSAVAAAAGKVIKKSVLELGGSDPYLILEDADLEHAAEACAKSRLLNSGQSCIAAKRFIVTRKVKEAFTEKFVEKMAARKSGDPEAEDTDIGPLARRDLREELHQQVAKSVKAGAKVLLGGDIPQGKGFYYPPTVLDQVKKATPAANEELFGPVAAIIEVMDTEEAVRVANNSSFGLGAAVFTRDIEKGEKVARRIQSGAVFINDFVKSDPRQPFGGIKKSGFGRELSHYGIHEFVNIKTIVAVDGPKE